MSSDEEMTLLEHFQELRWRLLRSLLAWLIAAVALSPLVPAIIAWLAAPLGERTLVALTPTETAIIYFQMTLAAGFAVAFPYIAFQLYRFLAPGLYPSERRLILVGLPAASVLFALGILFAVRVLLPLALPFLTGMLRDVVRPLYSLREYLAFVTTLSLWMGLLFQTPLLLYALAYLGLVTPAQLRRARRWVIFGAAFLAAVITPTTDPVTMLLVTLPFVALYEGGVLLARLAARPRQEVRPE